jgi:CBS domain-containing protein
MEAQPLLLILCPTAALAGAGWRGRARPSSHVPTGIGRRRRWHPRTPDDCPYRRGMALEHEPSAAIAPSVRPWAEVKSQRGAPKRRPTAGYACPSPTCPSFGIADDGIHVLIAYGYHGTHERIRDLFCQACGNKVIVRRNSALYRLKTSSSQVGVVLSALAEGLDVAAAVRVVGYREAAITGWLNRASQQAERLHDVLLRDLCLPHLQLDEIRTRLRARERVLWLWVAIDPLTKLMPVVHLGPRTQESAHQLAHAVRSMLAPGGVPVVTSDGLRLYYYALTAHFGQWVSHIWQFFLGNFVGGLWIAFIGWFLLQAAQAANSQAMLESIFKGVPVSQLMSPAPITAQAELSLQALVDGHILPSGVRAVPVVRGDQLAGLITLADVRHVPRERWPQTTVGTAMIPLDRLHAVRAWQSLNDVLPLMAGHDVNQLPVVDETGRLAGMLYRDAILRYVEVRRGLGLEPGDQQQAPGSSRPPAQLPRVIQSLTRAGRLEA